MFVHSRLVSDVMLVISYPRPVNVKDDILLMIENGILAFLQQKQEIEEREHVIHVATGLV